ncbi:MAG: SIS domain-containing protein [Kineosporiaceae bacterium]
MAAEETIAVPVRGHLMAAEIAEQPTVWRHILAESSDSLDEAAAAIRSYRPRFVLLVARGTSDHAALYAKYLIETRLELAAGLVSPSTMTAYGARPDLREVLMIAVSQSGGSPDLVRSLEVAGEQGALTLAVTNNPDSALARTARWHLDIRAGAELAVAATKSYTAEVLTLYLLLSRLRGRLAPELDRLAEVGERTLALDPHVVEVATRYRFAQRLVVTGRGFSYPTTREAALKLMETSYISAQAFSGADLLHGPLAMVEPQVPVILVAADGVGGRAMMPVLERMTELGADICCVGGREAVARSTVGLVLPEGLPEELSPLIEIIPLQQLALHLALARGADPDAPRGLRKITRTL